MNNLQREYIKKGLRPSEDLVQRTLKQPKISPFRPITLATCLCLILVMFITKPIAIPFNTPSDIIHFNPSSPNLADRSWDFAGQRFPLTKEKFEALYPNFSIDDFPFSTGWSGYYPSFYDMSAFGSSFENMNFISLVINKHEFIYMSCVYLGDINDAELSTINGIDVYIFGYDDRINEAFFKYGDAYVSIETSSITVDAFKDFLTSFIKV